MYPFYNKNKLDSCIIKGTGPEGHLKFWKTQENNKYFVAGRFPNVYFAK